MKIDLHEEIEIPSGIDAKIEGRELTIKKENNALKRKISPEITVKIDGNKIIIEAKKATRNEKKISGSLAAHFKNMIAGVNEKYKYRLQAASVHFPMSVSFDNSKREITIKNFIGEKTDRKLKVREGVDVKVTKDIIEIESCDIEKAGQTAADIEKRTKIRNFDRRIYQDGIYIIEKPGRKFL
jgi:large subunit ribosomal protein L6